MRFATIGMIVGLSVLTCRPAVAQQCDQLLHQGIFDVTRAAGQQSASEELLSWFCDNRDQFKSNDDAESFAGSLGKPFGGLTGSLNYDKTHQDFAGWSQSLCSETNRSSFSSSSFSQYARLASTAVLQAFNQCISTAGLHVWIERGPDNRRFTFAAKFNSTDVNTNSTKLTGVSAGPNVTCDNLREGFNVQAGTVYRWQCARTDSAPVQMIVNANTEPRGGGTLTLPAINRNPTECAKVVTDSNEERIPGQGYNGVTGTPGFVLVCDNLPPGKVAQVELRALLSPAYPGTGAAFYLCGTDGAAPASNSPCDGQYQKIENMESPYPLALITTARVPASGILRSYVLLWTSEASGQRISNQTVLKGSYMRVRILN